MGGPHEIGSDQHTQILVAGNSSKVSIYIECQVWWWDGMVSLVRPMLIVNLFLVSLVPRPSHVFQRCTRKIGKAWSIW